MVTYCRIPEKAIEVIWKPVLDYMPEDLKFTMTLSVTASTTGSLIEVQLVKILLCRALLGELDIVRFALQFGGSLSVDIIITKCFQFLGDIVH